MSAPVRHLSLPFLKCVLGALMLGGLAWAAWMAGDLPAADPPGAKADGPGKEPKKRTEEEDDTPPKNPKVQRVEDEDPKARPPAKVSDAPEIDLLHASRQAGHPAVRKLFRELAVPHDVVYYKTFTGVVNQDRKREDNVEPIPEFIPDVREYKGSLTLTRFDSDWNPLKPTTPSTASISSILPYERLVLDAVKEFHGKRFKDLTRREQLVAAEQALAAAVRFHESAKQSVHRKGDGWEPLENELRKFLLDVRIEQLNELAEAKDWDQAFALTRRLAAAYTSPEDQKQIALPLADLLQKAMNSPGLRSELQVRSVRERLRLLTEQFPDNAAIKPIADRLKAQARELLDRAQKLGEDPNKREEAQELLKQAEETWPRLEGLRDLRIKLARSHPILRVGVRELPRFLSPARAETDTELRGVELLFESLVKPSTDETGAVRYRPGLSEGRPVVAPLGRRFALPRGAQWSNGKELTAGDVRFTVRYLLGQGQPGQGQPTRPGAWAGLLEEATMGRDPYQVTLTLRQGYLDPLALMTFKVLPSWLAMPLDGEEFGRKPVGSGPYVYVSPASEAQEYALFLANPNYGSRSSKRGLPWIQEVRFYATSNPVKDLQKNRIDLALDLTAEQAQELKKDADVTVPLPPRPVPNRRVYFLAVNLRRPALADVKVRRAIGLAINREKLLDEHFRGGLGHEVHRTLNGPYPAHAWACSESPRVNNAFNLFEAQVLAKEARGKVGPIPLSLKYPDGDPALARAMEALCAQVREATGIEVQPEKRDPRGLKEEIEVLQSFDLAYTHYDFPAETFSLWPLLGPGKNGENVFGFTLPDVETLLQELRSHRHFEDVKRCAQQLHEILFDEMPLVPLWQLDPLLAWHRAVKPVVPVDPLLVFPDVDQWRVDPRQ